MLKHLDSISGYILPGIALIFVGGIQIFSSRLGGGWNKYTSLGVGFVLLGILIVFYAVWEDRKIEVAERSTLRECPRKEEKRKYHASHRK